MGDRKYGGPGSRSPDVVPRSLLLRAEERLRKAEAEVERERAEKAELELSVARGGVSLVTAERDEWKAAADELRSRALKAEANHEKATCERGEWRALAEKAIAEVERKKEAEERQWEAEDERNAMRAVVKAAPACVVAIDTLLGDTDPFDDTCELVAMRTMVLALRALDAINGDEVIAEPKRNMLEEAKGLSRRILTASLRDPSSFTRPYLVAAHHRAMEMVVHLEAGRAGSINEDSE